MSEITSGMLAAALNQQVINEAFDIARSSINGVIATASFGASRPAEEGSKLNWLDFRIDATSSALTAGISAGATTVPVVDGSKFRAGMAVTAVGSDEVMVVTSVSANDLTVLRGQGGTVAASVLIAVDIVIDSVSREENSLAENDGIFQPEKVENFYQTMDTAVEMSRRALATLQFGNTNDLAFQVNERMRQLAIQLNRALVRGRKMTQTIGGKEVTYTGGLGFFTDQAGALKVDNAGGALTLAALNNLNAQIVERGGMANTIAVGINKAREINNLVAGNFSSQRLADWTSDEGSIMRLPTDLPLVGNVNTIVIDTNIGNNELYIYDSSKLSIIPMASNNANASGDWRTLDATQPGQDGQRVRIIGDFGMEIRQSKTHMARLHNIG